MSYRPPFIVVDFETVDDDGPSLEMWRSDFRVISMAASWLDRNGEIKSDFMRGECAVEHFLSRTAGIRLGAHNIAFEMGVAKCRFPELKLDWAFDTMRLVQVADNGGDKFALEKPLTLDDQLDALEHDDEEDSKPESIAGLGLVKSLRRVLNQSDHKEPHYKWLRENVDGCKRGREWQFLDRLPPDRLRAYNVGDTEAALKLYVHLVDYFASIGYDWRLDHQLYLSTCRYVVDAKIRGVAVQREALEQYRGDLEREIEGIGRAFSERFSEAIKQVERARLLVEVKKRKTLRGKRGIVSAFRLGKPTVLRSVSFNVGSNKQLASLFVDVLGMRAKFETAKGAPSFRSAVLSQWSSGGEMLKTRRKRMLVLKQCEALLALSAIDGRWHMDLRVAATATGRAAGGTHAA